MKGLFIHLDSVSDMDIPIKLVILLSLYYCLDLGIYGLYSISYQDKHLEYVKIVL